MRSPVAQRLRHMVSQHGCSSPTPHPWRNNCLMCSTMRSISNSDLVSFSFFNQAQIRFHRFFTSLTPSPQAYANRYKGSAYSQAKIMATKYRPFSVEPKSLVALVLHLLADRSPMWSTGSLHFLLAQVLEWLFSRFKHPALIDRSDSCGSCDRSDDLGSISVTTFRTLRACSTRSTADFGGFQSAFDFVAGDLQRPWRQLLDDTVECAFRSAKRVGERIVSNCLTQKNELTLGLTDG